MESISEDDQQMETSFVLYDNMPENNDDRGRESNIISEFNSYKQGEENLGDTDNEFSFSRGSRG